MQSHSEIATAHGQDDGRGQHISSITSQENERDSSYLTKLQSSHTNNSTRRRPKKRASQIYAETEDSKSISVVTAGHSNIQIIEQEYGQDHDETHTQTTKGEQRLEVGEQFEIMQYNDFLEDTKQTEQREGV